jgi:hypothetical protein
LAESRLFLPNRCCVLFLGTTLEHLSEVKFFEKKRKLFLREKRFGIELFFSFLAGIYVCHVTVQKGIDFQFRPICFSEGIGGPMMT